MALGVSSLRSLRGVSGFYPRFLDCEQERLLIFLFSTQHLSNPEHLWWRWKANGCGVRWSTQIQPQTPVFVCLTELGSSRELHSGLVSRDSRAVQQERLKRQAAGNRIWFWKGEQQNGDLRWDEASAGCYRNGRITRQKGIKQKENRMATFAFCTSTKQFHKQARNGEVEFSAFLQVKNYRSLLRGCPSHKANSKKRNSRSRGQRMDKKRKRDSCLSEKGAWVLDPTPSSQNFLGICH